MKRASAPRRENSGEQLSGLVLEDYDIKPEVVWKGGLDCSNDVTVEEVVENQYRQEMEVIADYGKMRWLRANKLHWVKPKAPKRTGFGLPPPYSVISKSDERYLVWKP